MQRIDKVIESAYRDIPRPRTPANNGKPSIAADCPACGGIGWQRLDVPFNHPDFAKLFPCEICGLGKKAQWLEKISRLSPEMRQWELGLFKDRNNARQLLSEALDKQHGWVVLSGPPGTGKTYLLGAMVNEAGRRGIPAVYITMAELLADLRDTFNPTGGQGFSSLFNSILEAKLLALDEIEKFRPTPWAEEQAFRLFEQRYRNWDQCITILATNKRVNGSSPILEETNYPGYIESRLMDGRFTRLSFWDAPDARPALREDK